MPIDLTLFITHNINYRRLWITPDLPGGIINTNTLVPSALTPGIYSAKYALGNAGSNCRDSDSVAIRILPVLDPSIDNEPSSDICVADMMYDFNESGDPGFMEFQ